jgi:tRNA G18 (ribose-2'-O)-methylase SpoU
MRSLLGADAQPELAVGATIDDIHHPIARRIADALRGRSARLFVIDDEENIRRAVRCDVRLESLYLTEGLAPSGISTLRAVPYAVPCRVLSVNLAKRLFGGDKRSRVFALAHPPPQPALEDLSTNAGDIVVLDGVQLVGNIGAITRTACALGAAGLVLVDSGLRTNLDRRLVRASRGLVFAIPVILASRGEFSDYARREQIPLACLSADAPEPLSAIGAVPERLALVMGSERRGISDGLLAHASYRYSIPMTPDVESLNVSVAAAIALYEHRRRR